MLPSGLYLFPNTGYRLFRVKQGLAGASHVKN